MLSKVFVSIILFLLLLACSFAQYTGGNQDGYNYAVLTQIGCPSLIPNYIYYGGNNGGVGNGSLTQSTCSPINTSQMFLGGSNDGYANGFLIQSACLNYSTNYMYFGGNNDGYGNGSLTQSNCLTYSTNYMFYGGNNDGFSNGTVIQSPCASFSNDFVFYGGNNDGFSKGTIIQSTCASFTVNYIYFGGKNDGFSKGIITQSTCAPYTTNFMYYGGKNDGFGKSLIEQTLCTGITPLPIELLSFSAVKNNTVVLIKWQTASEINNDYFTIEKSEDGITFNKLVIVDGAGNSNSLLNYSTTDVNPYKGITYYRLMQTDFDGKFKYSNIISINFDDVEDQNINIYPNPNTGIFFIQGPEKESVITIQNVMGEPILTFKVEANTSKINLSNQPHGIYFVCFSNDKGSIMKKIILSK